jgi:hypothetical protein
MTAAIDQRPQHRFNCRSLLYHSGTKLRRMEGSLKDRPDSSQLATLKHLVTTAMRSVPTMTFPYVTYDVNRKKPLGWSRSFYSTGTSSSVNTYWDVGRNTCRKTVSIPTRLSKFVELNETLRRLSIHLKYAPTSQSRATLEAPRSTETNNDCSRPL